ncbi:MAG: DegV family protein [Clostridia bacterium]|nr:DegV family protein [Clostridia bacterium]
MSQNYKLFTDTASDLPEGIAAQYGIKEIPLRVFFGDEEVHPTIEEFYKRMRAGEIATTSAPNLEDFISRMEPVLQGGSDILYLAFSSGLSATCQAGRLAAKELEEKYPGRTVRVVDTLAASTGFGLLVTLAARKKEEGMGLAELADWVEETKLHLCHWFTVDDLMFLKRGGRVSAAAAIAGTLIGIKPVLHVDNEGHLIPMAKVRGRRASIAKLCEKVKETAIDPASQTMMICHGDCIEDANEAAEFMRSELGVPEVLIAPTGPVIGAHSGPGTLALFFLGTER